MLRSFVDELTNQRPARRALVKVAKVIPAREIRNMYVNMGLIGAGAGGATNLLSKAKYKVLGGDTRDAYEALGSSPLRAAGKTGLGGLSLAAALHLATKAITKGR